MLTVLACINRDPDPWLVTLAMAVCLAGALTFVWLLRGGMAVAGGARRWWVGFCAVAGGGTMWATHFIAILAHSADPGMAFNVVLTGVSIVAAVGCTWIGAYLAAWAGRGRPGVLAAAGGAVGAGIGAMHHLGMQALAFPGHLRLDPAHVAVSLATGCVLSAGAVLAASRDGRGWFVASTTLFVAAIAGLHFMGMAGTVLVPDGRTVAGWPPGGPWLAVAVTVASATLLALCAGASVIKQNVRLRALDVARLHELSVQSVRFQAALDNMSQGLCLFDQHGRMAVRNKRFAAMFRPAPDGVPHPMASGHLPSGTACAPADGGPGAALHRLDDGRILQVLRQAIPGAGWVATYEDVTERERARDQLSWMAQHDALTGLPNRVMLHEQLRTALDGMAAGGSAALLYIDLDGFKAVNDTLGHLFGDKLLRAVAERIRAAVSRAGTVARLGGDEFAIVLAGGRPHDAAALCERVVAVLREPFSLQGHRVTIGCSIGCAQAEPFATPDGLLRQADLAMYRAKASGRGAWRLYEAEMDAEVQARRALEADLREALASNQFDLHYQALVDARTQELTGFEALLRWDRPGRGRVPPGEFITVAEEIGLLPAIGAWVLRRACADAAAWPRHVKVAVNLSPVQFLTGDLLRDVEQALAASGLPARRLEVEITESVLMGDNDATLGILHRLRGLGVRVSMDDFGTGYSSLSYLRRFPFDKIKIDQSFTRNIGADKESVEIIRAVVGLGKALHMAVLAEGVETEEQFRALQQEGCDELQGYLFSIPKPVRELNSVIAAFPPKFDTGKAAAAARLTLVARQGS